MLGIVLLKVELAAQEQRTETREDSHVTKLCPLLSHSPDGAIPSRCWFLSWLNSKAFALWIIWRAYSKTSASTCYTCQFVGWPHPFSVCIFSSPVFPHLQAAAGLILQLSQLMTAPFQKQYFLLQIVLCLKEIWTNIYLAYFEHHCILPQYDEIMAWLCLDWAFPSWDAHSHPLCRNLPN